MKKYLTIAWQNRRTTIAGMFVSLAVLWENTDVKHSVVALLISILAALCRDGHLGEIPDKNP